MEQVKTYKFSKGLRQAKKRYVTLSILLPVIFIAFLFLSPTTQDESLITKAGIGCFLLFLIGLISYFTGSTVLRKLSELSVSIFPDKLEREDQKQKEVFLWKDLQHSEILEYPNGETASLKLTFTNKNVVTLFGFEDMTTATKEIEQQFPNNAPVRRKRMKINWDQPIIFILSGLLTLVIILAIQKIGEKAYNVFINAFWFSFGLYYLISRPVSRAQGAGWKMFETIIGILLIVFSVFLIALELFLK